MQPRNSFFPKGRTDRQTNTKMNLALKNKTSNNLILPIELRTDGLMDGMTNYKVALLLKNRAKKDVKSFMKVTHFYAFLE